MSEMSEKARDKAKAKAERLVGGDPREKVDSSSWTPPESMHTTAKTGMRPISRRQFKKGGKVMGEKSAMHAGRKPRKSGGSTLTANSLVNRDVKEANQERDGEKFIGGMKKGGRAHKMVGGPMMGRPGVQGMGSPAVGGGRPIMASRPGMRAFAKGGMVHGKGCDCGKCAGGRVGKAEGGKIKSEFAANRALAQPKGSGGTDYFAHVARSGTGSKTPNLPLPKKGGGSVSYGGSRPTGDRIARKAGGRAKKGTNINIIIAPGGGAKPPMPMPPPGALPPGPVGLHQGAPPPPMAPPGAAPPMGPPPMGRKRGGRAYPIDSGAGGGLGRLEKARAYG